MFRIADAHCDTLYRIAIDHTAQQDCVVTPERMRAGGVSLQTFALFCGRNGTQGTPYQDGLAMLKASFDVPIPFLRGRLPEAMPDEPTGILSCEGGEMYEGSLERFREFDDAARLRMIALTWNFENEIGYPAKSGSAEGLKPFGRTLLDEMGRAGVLADVSHLNDAGFWDVVERSALPPIASHSDCRWLCGSFRNLTKEMVRAIVERRGFIGVNFYASFLSDSGEASLDDVVRHIDELMELGAEDVIGFGSDFDGIEAWPDGLASPADFPNLTAALRRRGYSEAQLNKLCGENLWRVLKEAEAARRY